jgi:hypothetical protein
MCTFATELHRILPFSAAQASQHPGYLELDYSPLA